MLHTITQYKGDVMNVKRIKARTNINYRKVVEKIVGDKSITPDHIVIWLIRELTLLQKYILELLIDRISTQVKMSLLEE